MLIKNKNNVKINPFLCKSFNEWNVLLTLNHQQRQKVLQIQQLVG
ncbi:hypothetical protein A33Q_2314 [Indibacter alkaliphilus LW1]|uniref:Uncharacterized protein n=1 Tax=Indibacter alkaliphilus (strain CCUG 57479 / KCTC 22604 / LW1) TaxID=1189612 RepID=S2DCB7_INDAL|nr:hypothetical protein A33Q_2314 [Indibacter alkaliphilus LW1]